MANNTQLKCSCEKTIAENKKKIQEESFAMTLLKEYAKAAKKWFIIAIVILSMWIATIFGFIYYLNQFDASSTQISASQDRNGVNVVSGGDYQLHESGKPPVE